jgi:signal transduction histidine kinase
MTPSPIATERILLCEPNDSERTREIEVLNSLVPSAEVFAAENIERASSLLNEQDFDIVIFDGVLADEEGLRFIQTLRLRDHDPSVIFLVNAPELHTLLQMHNSGAQKLVLKQEGWLDGFGTSVRQLLRIRRLEQENRLMMAKLMEANILLEEKNRRLDEFSATVAHDIRGPLGGISMKLEYILDVYEGELEGRLQELLKKSLVSVQRLTDIVQAMYDFAKLGAKAARMIDLDLQALVTEVVSDLPLQESEDISIFVGPLPRAWGNPELLRRLFSNLVSNAIKYNSKTNKQVSISCSGTSENSLASFVEIAVKDNGDGIDPADLREVFSIFRRGGHQPMNSDGLGVGLAVVRRIIELHYGKIRVESTVQEGTTFFVTLPSERISFGESSEG